MSKIFITALLGFECKLEKTVNLHLVHLNYKILFKVSKISQYLGGAMDNFRIHIHFRTITKFLQQLRINTSLNVC